MLVSFLEIQQSYGHFTQPREEYLTETQLLTKRGFRFHTALGHSDPLFHHGPGPSIYKPINPVLFTNSHLSGIDSHMAVILITQMVDAKKNTTDIGLLWFWKSQISSKCRFSWKIFEMGGNLLKACELVTGWFSLQMHGVREKPPGV